MYFYCILSLFSKQSMKEFGPCEMIYLSLAQWTRDYFCNPNNISMKAWPAEKSQDLMLYVFLTHLSLC